MSEEFQKALVLLVIGMITVITILLLVVLSASLLIKLVNKFGPEPQIKQKKKAGKIDSKKLAVLAAVVEHITEGKGVITDIKKG